MKASVGNHKGKVKGQLHEQFFFKLLFFSISLSQILHMYLKKSFYEEDAADVMLMIFVCVVTNVNYQLQVNDVFEPKKL